MVCRVPVKTSLEVASNGLRMNKAKKMSLSWMDGKGRCVVVDEPIKAGEFVCEYKYSKSYPASEFRQRDSEYEENGEGCYVLEVVVGGKKVCIDATVNLDCYGRYINHSPRTLANLKMFQPLMVRRKWRVAFLAIRDIHAGEELGFDYGDQKDKPEWMKRKG